MNSSVSPAAAGRQVKMFGSLRVSVDGRTLAVPAGYPQTLFAYLLLNPGTPHPRPALADTLWPDAPADRVRRRLTETFYRLRRAVGDEWFDYDAAHIALRDTPSLWVDARHFSALVDSGQPDELRRAVDLYREELLPELDGPWLIAPRVALHERYVDCLLRLGRQAEAENRHAQADVHYRRLIGAAPLFEAAYRGRMRTLAARGRTSEALDLYEALTADLQSEVDAVPAPATRELAATLRRDAAPVPTPRPFVGRAAERGQLLALLDRARRHGGGVAVVLGEAGMGKTRLLEELAAAASWRGWQVVWGTALEQPVPAPFSPLAEALDEALPAPRRQQLRRLVPQAWLSAAQPLVPALEPGAGAAARRLPEALGHLLAGLGGITPHLLLLDDVQWADLDLWRLLDGAARHLADVPLVVVLSSRPDGATEQWDTIRGWEREGAPVIQLSGLNRATLQGLAGNGLGEDDVERLTAASGGNPLLALALLDAGFPENAPDASSLDALFRRRLERLGAPAALALQSAAVLGYRFPYPLWEAVTTAVPPPDLPVLAGDLERAGLLRLRDSGYQFDHDLLRAFVLTSMPGARRRDLHARALAAAAAEFPTDTQGLLTHAVGAKAPDAIAMYALRAGDEAAERLAHRSAVAFYALALTHLPDDDLPRRFAARRGRAVGANVLGDRSQQEADSRRLQALARRLGDSQRQAEAAYYRAHYLWMVGDQEAAAHLTGTGLDLARDAGDQKVEALLFNLRAGIDRNRGDYNDAMAALREALERHRTLADRAGAAGALDKLANLTYEAGDYAAAAARHEEAAALFRGLKDEIGEARTLSGLALVRRAQGDYPAARALHRQLLERGQVLEYPELQWVQQVNLGNICVELGDPAGALAWFEKALPLIRRLADPYAEALVLNNIGETRREVGDSPGARAAFRAALGINEKHGYRRGIGLAHQGIGLTWLDEGRLDDAREMLTTARDVWDELEQLLKRMETDAALALAYLAGGDLDGARRCLDAALGVLTADQRHTAGWRLVHLAACRVHEAAGDNETALDHLCQAAAAVNELAERLPAEHRPAFRRDVRANRRILEALATHEERQTVRLARAGTPDRAPAADPADPTVTVTWTVSSPLDRPVEAGPARRRHVLRRLVAQARNQGAAPTDDDLAAALGVSRRTILRDVAALAEQGIDLPTRGR